MDLIFVPHDMRQLKMKHALSNSFGFGGTNASLLLSTINDRIEVRTPIVERMKVDISTPQTEDFVSILISRQHRYSMGQVLLDHSSSIW